MADRETLAGASESSLQPSSKKANRRRDAGTGPGATKKLKTNETNTNKKHEDMADFHKTAKTFDAYLPKEVGVLYKVPVVYLKGEDEVERRVCYFMTNGKIKFRHEGVGRKCPPTFFLQSSPATDEASADGERVRIYFSSSGTGKTVELAANSVTRNVDFSLLLGGIEDNENLETAQEEYYKACKALADYEGKSEKDEDTEGTLDKQVDAALEKRQDEAFHLLKRILKKNGLNDTLPGFKKAENLKVAVCLDEVYKCPALVRSIVSDRDRTTSLLADVLFPDMEVQILLSCAGTGAVRCSIGSDEDSFEPISPSAIHKNTAEYIFDRGLNDDLRLMFPDGQRHTVNYRNVREHFPFIFALLENGRMNSIAVRVFKMWREDKMVDQGKLVGLIIDSYIKANGLNLLTKREDQMLMGAAALATVLFQPGNTNDEGDVNIMLPRDCWEIEQYHSGLACGFKFDKLVKQASGNNPVVQYLMGVLGLIEPNPDMRWEGGFEIKKPYQMNPPQELVALKLLGIDLERLLELTPFGFEVLTAHIIKCALTAASVVEMTERPTIKRTLAKVGFNVHRVQRNAGELVLTDHDVVAAWDDLGNWQPVLHRQKKDDDGHRDTFFMRVELMTVDLLDSKVKHKKDNDKLLAPGTYLQIDPRLFSGLDNMVPIQDKSGSVSVFAPVASLNFGTSPLFDGGVTFHMQGQNRTGEIITKKFSILNQAKDYSVGTDLKLGELKKHAGRCKNKALSGVFGENRLLCVSGRAEVIRNERARQSMYGRPFVTFAVNDSLVLSNLLTLLDEKRTTRKEAASFVDEEGNDVSNQFKQQVNEFDTEEDAIDEEEDEDDA